MIFGVATHTEFRRLILSAQTWGEEAVSRQTEHLEVLEAQPSPARSSVRFLQMSGALVGSLRPSPTQLCPEPRAEFSYVSDLHLSVGVNPLEGELLGPPHDTSPVARVLVPQRWPEPPDAEV